MPDIKFGPISHWDTVLNTGPNLLELTWGIASFPIPNQISGNFVFYVSGAEGISVHHLLHNGNFLEIAQSLTDTPDSLLTGLDNIEVVRQGGKSWLIGVAHGDSALNVYEINAETGLLTFASAVSEGLALTTTATLAQLRVGNQSFVLTFNRLNDNLGIWQVSDSGVPTRVNLVSGAVQPLAGVGVVASLQLDGPSTNRDGFSRPVARG